MESENCQALHARVIRAPDAADESKWRRQCSCLRTSEKLREIIKTFPTAPPPTPSHFDYNHRLATYYTNPYPVPYANYEESKENTEPVEAPKVSSRSWQMVYELVQLVQLSVTATALALYYLIYCYMQLVYYTLRSALFFHNADGHIKHDSYTAFHDYLRGRVTNTSVFMVFAISGLPNQFLVGSNRKWTFCIDFGPMKITIGVVTVTSIIVGFNLLLRMEKIIGIF